MVKVNDEEALSSCEGSQDRASPVPIYTYIFSVSRDIVLVGGSTTVVLNAARATFSLFWGGGSISIELAFNDLEIKVGVTLTKCLARVLQVFQPLSAAAFAWTMVL
jgi:hypothetical protein